VVAVVGASAGGVEALMGLVGDLPEALPAALFVVLHVPASGPSLLAEILSKAGRLPAGHPRDGQPIGPGRIYIARPDHHMLVEQGHIHNVRGPKENGFRPAVDATFRTAARAYGPRVVGVVLTGMLDDGTAGTLAIKRRGGVAIAQDPAEAIFPEMPASAIRYAHVDAVRALAEIPPMLGRLAHEPITLAEEVPMSEQLDLEAGISEMDRDALQRADQLGTPSPFSCPDCGGVLAEFYDGDLLRFRCQVGHAFSRESLLASQAEMLDGSLWAAYRALDERATLARRLVRDARRLQDHTSERRFAQLFQQAESRKEQIRQAMLKGENGGAPGDRPGAGSQG
jgi:two-component system chemotaxis response regulator CheB